VAASAEVGDPILVPIAEAARLLSCSTSLVKLMIRRGEIRTVKLGRLTRIPRAHLEDLFSKQKCLARIHWHCLHHARQNPPITGPSTVGSGR